MMDMERENLLEQIKILRAKVQYCELNHTGRPTWHRTALAGPHPITTLEESALTTQICTSASRPILPVPQSPLTAVTKPALPSYIGTSISCINSVAANSSSQSHHQTALRSDLAVDEAGRNSFAPPAKKRRTNSKVWETIAEDFIREVVDARGLGARRKYLGLDSHATKYHIFAAIAGVDNARFLVREDAGTITPNANAFTDTARAYARMAKASSVDVKLSVQLQKFRLLVFVTLCAVLERQKVPVKDIDEVMQICISNSQPETLKRLRAGALWVNGVISGLSEEGWGYEATELFFLCEYFPSSSEKRLFSNSDSWLFDVKIFSTGCKRKVSEVFHGSSEALSIHDVSKSQIHSLLHSFLHPDTGPVGIV